MSNGDLKIQNAGPCRIAYSFRPAAATDVLGSHSYLQTIGTGLKRPGALIGCPVFDPIPFSITLLAEGFIETTFYYRLASAKLQDDH